MDEIRISVFSFRKKIEKHYRVLLKPDFKLTDSIRQLIDAHVHDLAKGKARKRLPPGVVSVEEILEP